MLVDERNYQRVLDNREAALSGALHSIGKYLYTGTNRVKARFVEVRDDLILIEYSHLETGKRAFYKIYPFRRGELEELLKEAGFTVEKKFSDYEEGDNPNADFYQYVCIK